jgi:hypothetical protein
MKLLPAAVRPRVNYWVDIGQLVPIAAVNAQDAYRGAMAACYGPGVDCPAPHPVVYKIDPAGELIAVFD